MEKFKTFIKRFKFVIILFIILCISIGVLIYFLTRPPHITIQNYSISNSPRSVKVRLEEFLYRFLDEHEYNIKELNDVYIRESSYSKNEDDQLITESFLLDIDSLEITYQVDYTWSSKVDVPDGIIINCPEIADSKYPKTKCVGMYNNSEEMILRAKYPLITVLPLTVDEYVNNYSDHINYTITYSTTPDYSTVTILITDLTGDNYENAIKKITDMGYDLSDYTIEYKNQSSENYWPRINKY